MMATVGRWFRNGFLSIREFLGRVRKPLLRLGLFVVFVLITAYLAHLALPRTHKEFSCGGPLRIILASPVTLSPEGQDEVSVTVINGDYNTFSEVVIQLAYSGGVPFATGCESGNTVRFSELDLGERRSTTVEVSPFFRFDGLRSALPADSFKLDVKVATDRRPLEWVGEYELSVAPVPRTRWLLGVLAPFTVSIVVEPLRVFLGELAVKAEDNGESRNR
jgi:hypothetical protein